MGKIIMFCTFKLAGGVSEQDFMQISRKNNSEFMIKQKGYISWRQVKLDDTWADILEWESKEDYNNMEKASFSNPVAEEYFACLMDESINNTLFDVQQEMKS